MMVREMRAIPVSRPTSIPVGSTSEEPSDTETTRAGANSSARPVVPSIIAVTVSNVFKI